MAKVVRGKNHGQDIVLSQWCNDWFKCTKGNIYKPTSLKFTPAEIKKINKSDSGAMFAQFEWKADRLVPRIDSKPLTIKEARFVENMANPATKSPGQAAKDAGYSENSASTIANETLNKPYIIAAIDKRKAEAALHADITPEHVLGATALRAFATIDDAFDEYGYFDIAKARETGAIHLIKKIQRNQTQHGENVSVEFYSNESAQDRLGQYLGLEKQPGINPADLKSVAKIVADFRERIKRDADIYAETNGKYGYAMPDDNFVDAEIEKLCRLHKVKPEQLATLDLGGIG
jgi:phage terminase small subunit